MGLRRHQIENLILRGPVFYWRARIPVGFASAAGNCRLSLSLRLSDRKKASVVARRLNALLLQLELMPMARMATKEQLTKIFALEIDAVCDEIETLDRFAKRRGTLRDPVHREADWGNKRRASAAATRWRRDWRLACPARRCRALATRQATANACARSATRSSGCSTPIDSLIVESRTPIRSRTSLGTPEWVIAAGWLASDSVPPRLTASLKICKALRKANAAA